MDNAREKKANQLIEQWDDLLQEWQEKLGGHEGFDDWFSHQVWRLRRGKQVQEMVV